MSGERILIEGIGGIGGVLAGELIRNDYSPVLVTGNPAITTAINGAGLTVTTPERAFNVAAAAVTSLDDLPPDARFDIALLVMKATAVAEAARATLPRLEPQGGYMVPLQNGVVEDEVAAIAGEGRVVSGIVGWGGTMHEPGVYERTSGGDLPVGELDGAVTPRIQRLSAILSVTSPAPVLTNIRGALWSKLAINCTITTLGALTGQTLGDMLRDARVRRMLLALYSEVIDTADALGVRLERVAASPHLLYLPRDAGPLTRFVKDLLALAVGLRYRKLKSSSLQSLERGRPSEIDYLNGHVVRQAARAGVPVPLNAALVRLIKEIERGERTISPANMPALMEAGG